jgi:cellulose synthase/poly-beta-1,6-N-acetylglucosamine synthase-like glycosyltransferase
MNQRRASLLSSLTVLGVALLLTLAFVLLALLGSEEIQRVLLRGVVVSLVIFLCILFLRYFALLWFAYLGHAERNLTGGRRGGELAPISVIVPAYNEGEVLDEALRSLNRMDYPLYEVIVVDDGSTDDTLEVASRWEGVRGPATFRVVTQPNAGKAAALNTGVGLARHPFIFCMDADSQLTPGTLRMAMRHMDDISVGAVAGNVKVRNRETLVARMQALEYIEGLNLPRRAQGFVAAVNIVPGPVGLFRREALEEVGGYDTDTFAEDADLTMKLISAGWKVVYEDEAIAWTDAPERWIDLAQQRYRWTRGILQALRKRKGVLLRPFPDFPLWLSTLQLGFEAVVWPVLNIFAHLYFSLVVILFGSGELLVYWIILLSLLDLVAALVTLSMEEESLGLLPLALIYRTVFVLFLDVVKSLASLEEVFRLEMSWGKLDRTAVTAPSPTP